MENNVYPKMFSWLSIGLLITFISGYCLSLNEVLLYNVLSIGVIPIIIIELGIALFMGFGIRKMNPLTAKICYIIYCITTGVTFGTIFIAYKMASIILIFALTALMFALLAIYGYFTKKDITKIGKILFVALIGIIITSIVNIFLGNSMLQLGISIICILVFMGYIAYDIKKVKYLLNELGEDKTAVYGAFQLYLDFINLFIRLLQIFGKRND